MILDVVVRLRFLLRPPRDFTLTSLDVVGCNTPADTSSDITQTCDVPTVRNEWSPTDDNGGLPTLGAGGVLGFIYSMGTTTFSKQPGQPGPSSTTPKQPGQPASSSTTPKQPGQPASSSTTPKQPGQPASSTAK